MFKAVDSCAAEVEAEAPYFYSAYEEEDELEPSERQSIVILGAGPNRIGQGIEFDYCCVRAAQTFRNSATTRSWSTAIRRRCRPTPTPPTGSTSSR